MEDRDNQREKASERIELGGIAAGLSVSALRALLDPVTRDEALVDVDLSQLSVSVPVAALTEVLARVLPQGDAAFEPDGVTVRPGDGSPGLRVRLPVAGVRVRIDADGLRVGPG